MGLCPMRIFCTKARVTMVDLNQSSKNDPTEIAELDKHSLHSIGDTLLTVDVNLLSVTISHATPQDAMRIIADVKINTNIDLSDSKVINVLTSEQIEELKKFETSHRTQLVNIIQHSFSTEALNAHHKEHQSRSNGFRMWLGAGLVLFTLCYVAGITWIPIPETSVRFADTTLGFLLGTIVSTIVNFYFGSSVRQSDLARTKAEQSHDREREFNDFDTPQ